MVVKIPLRNSFKEIVDYALISDEDEEKVNQWKWHLSKGYPTGWIKIDNIRKKLGLHQYIIGKIDKNLVIDHIDQNKNNCQRRNLRINDNYDNYCELTFELEYQTIVRMLGDLGAIMLTENVRKLVD